MTNRALALAAAAAATLLLAGGCASDPAEGWSFRSTWPESIRTVAVDVFRNDSFDRDVAFELTDALVKEIEARTPYKVTAARDADTILTGRIRAVDRQQRLRLRACRLHSALILAARSDSRHRSAV